MHNDDLYDIFQAKKPCNLCSESYTNEEKDRHLAIKHYLKELTEMVKEEVSQASPDGSRQTTTCPRCKSNNSHDFDALLMHMVDHHKLLDYHLRNQSNKAGMVIGIFTFSWFCFVRGNYYGHF